MGVVAKFFMRALHATAENPLTINPVHAPRSATLHISCLPANIS